MIQRWKTCVSMNTDSSSAIVFEEAEICSRWLSRRGIMCMK